MCSTNAKNVQRAARKEDLIIVITINTFHSFNKRPLSILPMPDPVLGMGCTELEKI